MGNTLILPVIQKATTKEPFDATIPCILVDVIFNVLTVGLFFVVQVTTSTLSTLVTGSHASAGWSA